METLSMVLFMNLWLIFQTTYTVATPNELRDYCEKDIFHAECPMGEIIDVEEAQYGRMKLGTCLKLDIGFMDCFSNVRPILDALCSGRHSCNVEMSDFWVLCENWGLTNSCPEELNNYLQARYTCVKVVMPEPYCCQLSQDSVRIDESSGVISSSVTVSSGCGGLMCPWVVTAFAGQQINISLIDFQYDDVNGNVHSTACDVYAIVKEEKLSTSTTICGRQSRRSHVYTSTTNTVQISFVHKNMDGENYFLIEYEAFGCPNPSPPDHGFVERNGTLAKVSCHESAESDDINWEITCIDGVWHGEVGNCSAPVAVVSEVKELQTQTIFFGPEVIIALIIVVALLISVSILVIGILTIRRQSTSATTRYLYTTHSSRPKSRYSNYSPKGGSQMAPLRWSTSHPSNYENAHTLPKQWRQTMHQNQDMMPGDNTEHIYETPAPASGSVLYHTLDPEIVKMHREKRFKNNDLTNDHLPLALNRSNLSRQSSNPNDLRKEAAAYLS